jgi:hypothetical protein
MLTLKSFSLFLVTSLLLACGSNTDSSSNEEGRADLATQKQDQENASPEQARVTVWDIAPNAEAVAIGAGVIYAGHFGPALQPMTQDGDGYIATYDANGGLIENLVEGLDAPKGMEVIDNQLFVADIDSLLGFSTDDGSRTFAASFTGQAKFLNGLVAADDANLYISATDAGKIWKVNTKSGDIKEIASVPHVNGLELSDDGSVIYAVQYNGQDPKAGRLLAVNPADGTSSPLGTYGGMLDGVSMYNGDIYFTDWNPTGMGKVLKYDLSTQETTIVLEDERLQGPADFEVLGDGLALIPQLTGSKILGVRLN